MKRFLSVLICLMLLSPVRGQERRPNIVFVFTDDHATSAISAYGSTRNVTPNLDRLAREGVLMENFFCTNSICAPSRAAILTGLHSHANGQMTNQQTFDGSQTTMPKLLREAGYQTAIVGKWHLKSDPTGFDHWEVLPGQGRYYNPEYIHHEEGRRRVEGYSTDLTTEKAMAWMDGRDAERPFLLMVHYKAPHRSWQPGPQELHLYRDPIPVPPTLEDDYSRRSGVQRVQEMEIARHMLWGHDLAIDHPDDDSRFTYEATVRSMTPEQRATYETAFAEENAWLIENEKDMTPSEILRWKYQRYLGNYLRCVAGVDRNIGRLLDYLQGSGLEENTIVIYSSDQGFYLGEHGWFDKRWMYEESFRMPFIARWPGRFPAGLTRADLAQNIDVAPTLLDAAGAEVPGSMHGVSILSVLKGQPAAFPRSSIYYHFSASEAWHRVPAHYGVRTATHKLMYFYEHDTFEMYDLSLDPQEMNSVYGDPAYADVQEDLLYRLQSLRNDFNDTTGEPLP
ncbi:sulfatase family protein [Mucisphaera calidilacus]|uniref:Arylsulfatase n=1 Tax=Mucisphaera calidilacus TaxID=2527982 RepID=A0A518BWJ5_9BACT|nr:sulfatase [Mucisphaera calidilacus]QDU71349.1 Arylsulfatase [Mucisphaera calidilacus]